MHFKPRDTLRSILVSPKDKFGKSEKCHTVYNFQCRNCRASYIGKTKRPLWVSASELKREPSPLVKHAKAIGHSIPVEDVTILDSDPSWLGWGITEAATSKNTEAAWTGMAHDTTCLPSRGVGHVCLNLDFINTDKKLANDCYIMWKTILTEIPLRFNVEPLNFKWVLFINHTALYATVAYMAVAILNWALPASSACRLQLVTETSSTVWRCKIPVTNPIQQRPAW